MNKAKQRIRDDACPDKSKTNTKGDCVDLDGKAVPERCCNCGVKLDAALHYYQNRLDFYMQKCEVKREDIKPSNGDFLLMDDTRICSDKCQDFEELKDFRTFESWNVDQCSEEMQYQSLLMMRGVVQAMDSAWNNCEALFEPVAPHQEKSVFVIDNSGSMYHSRARFCKTDANSGRQNCRMMTRMDMVKEELPQLINGLEEGHEFALVNFGSNVVPFRSAWSKATSANKAAAVNWIRNLRSGGVTNLLKALKYVQARFPDYDAVSLLGDGASNDCSNSACLNFCPRGGCQKPVHTTLFMPGSGSAANGPRRLLQLIASKTGGKFREPFP